ADDVTGGEDVRHRGPKVTVHLEAPAIIGLEAGRGQVKRRSIPVAPNSIEEDVSVEGLPALEVGRDPAAPIALDPLHTLPAAECDAVLTHVVHERLDDLAVDELEQALTPVYHRDHGAERREHAGILHADHTGADHEHGAGDIRETEDAVGVDDRRAIDRYVRRYGGHGPRGDHEPLRADQRRGSLALDLDGVRIDERGVALEEVHAVARELRAVDIVLFLDHV